MVVGGLNRKVLHAEGEWLAFGSRIARSITILGSVWPRFKLYGGISPHAAILILSLYSY